MIIQNFATQIYHRHMDNAVKDELMNAGIPVLTLPSIIDGEVKTRYIGVLNGFVFTRAWRYWCCTGDIPIAHAQEIYARYHDLMIRAAGHAGNPDPIQVSYSPAQRKREKELVEGMLSLGATNNAIISALQNLDQNTAEPRFIEGYHIDTTEGLETLAHYIKENKIYAQNGAEGTYAASIYQDNR